MKTTFKFLMMSCFILVFQAALAQVPASPKPSSTNTPTSGKSIDMATVNANLAIINNAFETYNSYKTKFRLEGSTLLWKNAYTEVSGQVKDLIFYADYDKEWLAIKCRSGECMEGTSFKDEYSMSLRTESGEIAPVIEEVVNALNLIREAVLRK